jgi:hypothetical protein
MACFVAKAVEDMHCNKNVILLRYFVRHFALSHTGFLKDHWHEKSVSNKP